MRLAVLRTAVALLLLPKAAALQLLATPASPCNRLVARMAMNDAELTARQRWLERTQRDQEGAQRSDRRPAEDEIAARQRLREVARKRMLGAMGGNDALQSGAGVAFGFGMSDNEDYGYDPQRTTRCDQEERVEVDLPTWFTSDPVGAKDAKPVDGGGFDGRPKGWGRKIDTSQPNPPPVLNTLRAPGQVPMSKSVPVQQYMYVFTPQNPPEAPLDAAEATRVVAEEAPEPATAVEQSTQSPQCDHDVLARKRQRGERRAP